MIKAETPNELTVCFSEKIRTIKNVIEYGDDGEWMVIRTYDSEILVNKDKVNWVELKQF
jgi:hypothetical protein